MPKKDEAIALKELIRVTKPGGKLFFLEYVYSKNPFRKIIMRITSFIPKILYSLRFDVTLSVIQREKQLNIKKLDFVYEDVIRLIVAQKI
jgi:ubiquinone/menaquinone biosynthesis C-methylase UbiE